MADTKLTGLTEETAPATTDIMYVVTDPGGTPTSEKVTIANLKTAMGLGQGCRVYNSGNISVNNSTSTALTFDSERYDTDTIHSTSTNTGRLTCNTAGKYHIFGHVQFDNDADGARFIAIRLGGTTTIAAHSSPPSNIGGDYTTYMSIDTVYDLAATNYVELVVLHTAGAALNIIVSGNFSPEFGMQRIG